MAERPRVALLARLGRLALDGLLASARFQIRGQAATAGGGVIFTLWHGRLLPLTYLHRGQGIATLISRSGDGEYIARIVEGWGYVTARGSSSRGGSTALRELVRAAREGRSLAFTPDGPRGPRERIKPGVLTAAQLTGLPLVPMSGGTDRAWWFESWDRFLVPKPFARIRVAYGQPIRVPRDADAAALDRIGGEVQAELCRLTRLVDDAGAFHGRG
ncbi:MAG: lysophospholipid acyltransferase family protein [Longimicrobiales bacterium]